MSKFAIYWDNGASACGTFPGTYDTREEAEAAAAAIEADNLLQDVWDTDGFCEVIAVDADGNQTKDED